MNFIQALVLSVIEGVTEFLPISSTGHLILFSKVLKVEQTEFLKTFEIFIQLGAILSVVLLYRKSFLTNFSRWKKILTAFFPTAVIGFIFYKIVKTFFLGNSLLTISSLVIGGIILIVFEKNHNKESNINIDSLSYKDAAIIGICQSISIVPGVSRAAATIVGGLVLGLSRKNAVEFSF